MKTLILQTDYPDENGQRGGEFACGVVEVSPALVDQCRRRVELAKAAQQRDTALAEIRFQDATGPLFLDDAFLSACQELSDEFHDDFVNNESAVMPDGINIPDSHPGAIEQRAMVIRRRQDCGGGFEIAWSAVDPQLEFRLHTQAVPVEYLDQLLQAGGYLSQT